MIDRLVELEKLRQVDLWAANPERIEKTVRLDSTLSMFCLSIPNDELNRVHISGGKTLLEYLDLKASELDIFGHSLIRNLYRRLLRPQRYADPKWALEVLAESIYRGRSEDNEDAGSHKLLPRLISDICQKGGGDLEDRQLLLGSLALFKAALEDIKHYSDIEFFMSTSEVEEYSSAGLEWLKENAQNSAVQYIPSDLRNLFEALRPKKEFWEAVNQLFHEKVSNLGQKLIKHAEGLPHLLLEFTFCTDEESKDCRLLSEIHGLFVCLSNLTIDPIKKTDRNCRSKIRVHRFRTVRGEERLGFRLLTSFADKIRTQLLWSEGRSATAERRVLQQFGVEFADEWEDPDEDEKNEGFMAAFELSVMAGFVIERKHNEF